MNTSSYRLPRDVVPVAYDIALTVSPKRRRFDGVVGIDIRILEACTSLPLHARGLKIGHVELQLGGRRLAARIVAHPEDEVVVLHFETALARGRGQLSLHYTGRLNDNMHGLYLARDGRQRAIVSQCEATDARAIFPCFDEPDLKATLRWQVRTEPQWQVLCNGVLERRRKVRGADLMEHRFAPTRVISTYLAALTIGKMEVGAAETIAGIPCQIWSGPGQAAHTQFAMAVTRFVLPWYRRYFGQAYNYQKLDQVAVPGFDAGAMENVGAIFYRQNLLLVDPQHASWAAQKRVAEVVAHEIAHQWFGNLVTMRWWDDLWLNEAFATWIAYKVVDAWQPDWRIWDDYLEGKEAALSADALVHTHPVYTPVASPSEATELFDVITYEKGCAILRMVENFLGETAFRAGIRRYQAKFKNKNATGTDLWEALEAASEQPVGPLMRSWINQAGFPLLHVRSEVRAGRTIVHLRQQRFYAQGAAPAGAAPDRWLVPIRLRYGTAAGPQVHRALMEAAEMQIELPERASWVYPNDDATGFYRLHLDDAARASLLEHGLPHLTPAARMALLEDQWALVRSGVSGVAAFCAVLAAFRGEADHAVVRTLCQRLSALNQALVGDAEVDDLAAFVRRLLQPQLTELGWDTQQDTGPAQAVRRALVVGTLGELGQDGAVLARAQDLMRQEMADPTAVEANLAGVVVALPAKDGDSALLRAYVRTYQQRKRARAAPEQQARYLNGLASFAGAKASAEVLAMCLDDTVPQEQLRVVLMPRLRRRATQQGTWTFLRANWDTIRPRVGAMGIASLVEATGALPPAQRPEVQAFFAEHPVPEATRALGKALEALDLRRALQAREARDLGRWLREHRAALAAATAATAADA